MSKKKAVKKSDSAASENAESREGFLASEAADEAADEAKSLKGTKENSEIQRMDGVDKTGETLAENDRIGTQDEKIKELEEEILELKDRLIRKQADFENFRKRMYTQMEETAAYANSQLLQDIITIIDDFERALASAESSKDFDSFHQGIEMIEKQFSGMLENKWGLQRLDSLGEEFDPEKHQAIAMDESEEVNKPTVSEDYQKGYMLHSRVLRPAKVKVTKPLSPPNTETGSAVSSEEFTENQDDNNGSDNKFKERD